MTDATDFVRTLVCDHLTNDNFTDYGEFVYWKQDSSLTTERRYLIVIRDAYLIDQGLCLYAGDIIDWERSGGPMRGTIAFKIIMRHNESP